jgi:hypothetical protein
LKITEPLERTGKAFAHFCTSLIGLTILIGTPLVGIGASIWIGMQAAALTADYLPWAWMVIAILFGLPLLIIFYLVLYVWPDVFAAIERALKVLQSPN